MPSVDMRWQVQEAKQRLSEVLRAAEQHGVQYVTRHGREVAVILSIDEYHRLAGDPEPDLNDLLIKGPPVKLSDSEAELFQRPEDAATRETPFVGAGWDE